jgi:LacI family transcriptional regulator
LKTHREVTIYDVAEASGLSPSTVSRALKDHPHIKKDTKRKIRELAAEMGYQRNKFASNLRLRQTHTIGVVVPRLDSWFMATVLSGIEKVASANGYGIIISQSQESWKKELACVNTLYNSRVDGLLVSLASDTRDLEHYGRLLSKNIPVVFFDRVMECSGCLNIVIDNYSAAYEVARHLISRGCRNPAFIGGNIMRNVYSERLRGFRQALIDNGLVPDEKLVFITDMSSRAATDTARLISGMKKKPDGVFAANDTTAVALMVELARRKIRIPEDMAVAGFNNEPVSSVIQPNLTTVDYPAGAMGEMAALSLLDRLNNAQSNSLSTIVLKHKLIVRDST